MKVRLFDLDWYQGRYGLFAEGDGAEGGAGGGGGQEGQQQQQGGEGDQGQQQQGQQQSQQQQGQQQATDWRAAVQDEKLREHATRFTSLDDLVKANLESRQKLSTAIVPPGKDAKPEEVAAYRQKVGIPETPEGYVFTDPEGYQPTETDKAMRSQMAKAFHDNNVPAEVAKGLIDQYRTMITGQAEAIKQADERYAKESDDALKAEWGGDYEKNKTFATRAAKEVFGDQFDAAREIEDKTGRFVLDNPIMVKALAKIGREMGEDRIGAVISESDRGALNDQITSLRQQQAEAQSRGDNKKANELYTKEQALLAKIGGNQPVVGAHGRAA